MKTNFLKFKKLFHNIRKASRSTSTPKKKIRIFLSILFLNIATFFDIITILTFASFFEKTNLENPILIFFVTNNYFLPLYVLIRFTFIYLDKINLKNLQLEIEINLKDKLLNEVFSKGNYSQSDSFFYISQLTNHVAYFFSAFTAFVNVVIQSIVYFIYLSISNFNIISIFLVGILLLLPIAKRLSYKSRKYTDFVYYENKKIYDDIQKIVNNLFIIKIFKLNDVEIGSFKQKLINYKDFNFKSFNYSTLNYIIPNFITLFVLSVLISFFNLIKFFTLEFIGVIIRFFQSIGEINRNFTMLLNSEVHISKFLELEDNFGEDFSNNYVITKSDISSSLKFHNVSFKYIGSSEYIFENLNFELSKGENVLLTGENGSGKSTLLGLIAGVYFPEKGHITSNFKNIGYVGTEPSIITGTLRENLIYGLSKQINDEILFKWLQKIKLFPELNSYNLDLVISENTISSGQKQKISFIRMFIGEVDLLLLDEATSNLDDKSKEDIISILNNQNLTIINSTHLHEELKYTKKIRIDEKNIVVDKL